ncbi:2-C-methyl-D-erythritol 4-phosphate cytidylyltransferase, partial [bacterium]|nr:2-C-methyl-D-erythritol 4-phosphate cytidylyltransferase [bacterium]
QFINILGKPVIVYCLEAYQAHPSVNDIYVVCLKGWEKIVTAYADQFHISKLRCLIPAASSGILSVQNGINNIKEIYKDDVIIIFQESTRPMVTVDMISQLLQSCYENGSANICQSMKDFVQFTYNDKKATYLDRNAVLSLQSPEAYRFKIIKNVFETATKKQHPLTESCCVMLMYNLGYDINFIETFENNIKIVRPEDISIFTSLIKNRL